MPRGIPGSGKAAKKKRVVTRQKKDVAGVKPVTGFLTSEGKFSDDAEVAAFMEAAATVRKLTQQGEIKNMIGTLVGRIGGTMETYERAVARDILKAAFILSNVLRPISKRVRDNAIEKAKLDAMKNESDVATTQQRDLLDTDKLINKYL